MASFGSSSPRARRGTRSWRVPLQILARVFSHAALESYMPRIQATLRRELWTWCGVPGPVSVYSATKALTFRIAARILLGLRLEESECNELAKTFEQLMENLFSLPLDVPFSGLRKGIRARDLLHEHMEKAIREKLQRSEPGGQKDALDFIINSAKEQGWELTMQELKMRKLLTLHTQKICIWLSEFSSIEQV